MAAVASPSRPMSAIAGGRIVAGRQGHRPRRGGDRCQGQDRHARLRRHPHPLRRPGDLEQPDRQLLLQRRHHRADRQLRRRLRALPARAARCAGQADGRRRGPARGGAGRGPALDLGKLPRVHGYARRPPLRHGHRRAGDACAAARPCDGRARRGACRGDAGRDRRDGAAGAPRASAPARWASPPPAPSPTRRWTGGISRRSARPRTSWRRSAERSAQPARPGCR